MSSSSSSFSITSLFEERRRKFEKQEKSIPLNKRIENLFESFITGTSSKKSPMFKEQARKECLDLTSMSFQDYETVSDYVNFLYNNGETFLTFTKYYETHVKTEEEKVREMFEKIRFDIKNPDAKKQVFQEMERIISSISISGGSNGSGNEKLKSVQEYVDTIKDIGVFVPYFTEKDKDVDTREGDAVADKGEEWYIHYYSCNDGDEDNQEDDQGPFDSEEEAYNFVFYTSSQSIIPMVYKKKN